MPVIEIRRRTGAVETRELSKGAPILVGRQSSNDIHVDADGVAPIHCRISWKRRTFEVAAVTPEGVQWNGTTVRQSALSPGDVIRVGDVDIVLLAEPRPAPPLALASAASPHSEYGIQQSGMPSTGEIELRPITEDQLPVRASYVSDQILGEAPQAKEQARGSGAAGTEASAAPAAPDRARRAHDHQPAGVTRILDVADVAIDLDELAKDERRAAAFDSEAAPAPPSLLAFKKVRPGDQDPLRSPLVIGLTSGVLLLALSAATIWFVLSREAAQRQYDLAQSQLTSGQYPQAIESFQAFVRDNPRHKLAEQARAEIGTARVEQAIGGTSPAWDKGLEALNAYIEIGRAH